MSLVLVGIVCIGTQNFENLTENPVEVNAVGLRNEDKQIRTCTFNIVFSSFFCQAEVFQRHLYRRISVEIGIFDIIYIVLSYFIGLECPKLTDRFAIFSTRPTFLLTNSNMAFKFSTSNRLYHKNKKNQYDYKVRFLI